VCFSFVRLGIAGYDAEVRASPGISAKATAGEAEQWYWGDACLSFICDPHNDCRSDCHPLVDSVCAGLPTNFYALLIEGLTFTVIISSLPVKM
jgi:hypothetical protein